MGTISLPRNAGGIRSPQQAVLVFSSFTHGDIWLGGGIIGNFLSENEKAQWAVIASELNKTIKDERDAVLDHVSTPPQEGHLWSRESRLYVDEDSVFL